MSSWWPTSGLTTRSIADYACQLPIATSMGADAVAEAIAPIIMTAKTG